MTVRKEEEGPPEQPCGTPHYGRCPSAKHFICKCGAGTPYMGPVHLKACPLYYHETKTTVPRGETMKYVLEFEATTDKAALRAADCAKAAEDELRITRLTNVSYPDSPGHVLIEAE